MGTRAQFFIGDPRDLTGRQWLGCVAWDGYPDGDCGDALVKVTTERQFRDAVQRIAENRRDFCDPAKHSFPFPWDDDLFLTDCTYAWFDGAVQFTWFHRGFMPLPAYLAMTPEEADAHGDKPEELSGNVPAPNSGDRPAGPDSIIIVRAV